LRFLFREEFIIGFSAEEYDNDAEILIVLLS
jgi:hypothetical protein